MRRTRAALLTLALLAAVAAVTARGARADDPTDTPTDTPTVTPTETPTGTPTETATATPTATAPSGCAYIEVTPSAVYSVEAEGIDQPPAGTSCTTDAGDHSAAAYATSTWDDVNAVFDNTAGDIILTWDTASLPADSFLAQAVLRVHVMERTASDQPAVFGDWLGGQECAAGDYYTGDGNNDTTIAFAGGDHGDCGAACDLSALVPGGDHDFPVTSPIFLQLGSTRLRMRVAASGDRLRIATGAGELPGPRLIALACAAPTPTPASTAPAGCETQMLETASAASNLVLTTPDDAFAMCVDSLGSDGGPIFLAAGTLPDSYTYEAQMLLRWPTAELPADKTVTAAWLRLFAADVTFTDPTAAVVADWYDWGPTCDADDASAPPGDAALSSCGAACTLLNLGTYTDLPLDDAAAHLVRGSEASTPLRLRVSVSDGEGAVITALSSTVFKGPGLVVQLCAPTPTPTDTPMPTPTGTATLPWTPTATPTTTVPPDPALIAPAIDRSVASGVADTTAFLYSGDPPIQTGVAPGTIDVVRAAVIRGRVLQRGASPDASPTPLRAVRIAIADHAELGQTFSRDDGRFDLAVNGGSVLTVRYEKEGYLPAERQLTVPWHGYAFLPDVVLIQPDPAVTEITLDAGSDQLAIGSEQCDAPSSGSCTAAADKRQAVLFLPAGTVPEIQVPGGTPTPLSGSLHVRLSEFTVGGTGKQAMPADLPPTSAYTYAVDVTADEILTGAVDLPAGARVVFPTPIPLYVDNFVGFPVGAQVPLGAYDETAHAWVAERNGIVLQVVDNGTGIDLTGDGTAEDAQTLFETAGITLAEIAAIVPQYSQQTLPRTLWRVALSYFAKWDCNWPGGAPVDTTLPNGPPPSGADDGDDRLGGADTSADGQIRYQTQTLVERTAIVGTPFGLSYQSDRQRDRTLLNTVRIPLSGASLPASLTRITLTVRVAGREFTSCYNVNGQTNPSCAEMPAGNTTTFTWDGRDAYGRVLQGQQYLEMTVEFVSPRSYLESAQSPAAFALPGDTVFSGVSPRDEIVSGRTFSGAIGGWDAQGEGLGGWSLDVHKTYEPLSGRLNGGDGSQRTNAEIGPVIRLVAGNGSGSGSLVENIPAVEANVWAPGGVAVAADGSVYLSDTGRGCVRRIGSDGNINTVHCGIGAPRGLAVGPDGAVYVAALDHRIYRLDVSDLGNVTMSTVAGTGTRTNSYDYAGTSGDNGPAIADPAIPGSGATLSAPTGVAVAPDGTLYIADSGNNRVRRVGTDGVITTFAGGGPSYAYNIYTDGLPATQATFFNPNMDVKLGGDGSVYLSAYTGLVRRVTPDGTIATVIGGTGVGSAGDGGLATASTTRIWSPTGLAIGRDGTLYMADVSENNLRRVNPQGIITTLAGPALGDPNETTAAARYAGDTGPATAAKLYQPLGLALAPDGSLYVADSGNNRIRRIGAALPGVALGDIVVAAPNGHELYVFDDRGQHQCTTDTFTPRVRYRFGYADDGHLACIIDCSATPDRCTSSGAAACAALAEEDCGPTSSGDHSVTQIVHDTTGQPSYILGPYGQRTELAVDEHGYLSSITAPPGANAGGPQQQFTYTDNGLMQTATDPNGDTTTFAYDAAGRLSARHDPVDSGTPTPGEVLERTALPTRPVGPTPTGTPAPPVMTLPGSYVVGHTSAEGVLTAYQVEFAADGTQIRTTTLLAPTPQTWVTVVGVDGSRSVTQPDGTTQTQSVGPDPRFGMQAPIAASQTLATGDRSVSISTTRTAPEPTPGDPFSVTTVTDTTQITANDPTPSTRTTSRVVTKDTTTTTTTDTSPEGRTVLTVQNDQGQVISQQVGNLTATEFSYDGNGRLYQVIQGARLATLGYVTSGNGVGQLQSVETQVGSTDSRTVSFGYDAAGRVSSQLLPDGRAIDFSYYDNGSLATITPPGRPYHAFLTAPLGLNSSYIPPQPEPTPSIYDPSTRYAYNLDRQLVRITRPRESSTSSVETITFDYDLYTGLLRTQTTPEGVTTYSYDDDTGQLLQISTPDPTTSGTVVTSYTYNGQLPASESWSSPFSASVSRTYDNNLRVATQSVTSGSTITFGYDDDDLLTSAGSMAVDRDAQNGLVTGTTLGNVSDTFTPNSFGEVDDYEAHTSAGSLFEEAITARDDLGRITAKTEVVGSTSHSYVYGYDEAGRLQSVTTDSTLTGYYTYDDNGNRIPDSSNPTFNQSAGILTGATYDYQDRLVSTEHAGSSTSTAYTYTANGELASKSVTTPSTTDVTNYAYDFLGNLREVTLHATATPTVIDYVIDGSNRRVGKKVDGTLQQAWLYDGQLRIVAELNGSGTLVSQFVYGTKSNIPDYVIQGSTTYRVISDHLGSLRLVVNASTGDPVQQMDYDEFGYVRTDQVAGGFAPLPFGFAGGLYDRDTGLVRFGARDYDAETGRWSAKDPIGFNGGDTDLFVYAHDDPTNFTDPTGLYDVSAVGVGVALGIASSLASSIANNRTSLGELATAVASGAAGGLASGLLAGYVPLKGAVYILGASGLLGGVSGNISSHVVENWITGRPWYCGISRESLLTSGLVGLVSGGLAGWASNVNADTTTQTLIAFAFGLTDVLAQQSDPLKSLTYPECISP